MANKAKLREILAILSPDGTDADFKAFDEGVDKLKKGLKEKIQAKTLEDVNGQLRRFKDGLDFEPLFKAIKDIDESFDARIQQLASALADEVARFDELAKSEREETGTKVAESSGLVESLRSELATVKAQKEKETNDVIEALKTIPTLRADNESTFADIKARLDALEMPEEEVPDLISPINQRIDEVRTDLIKRITSNHGDHANRNIAIGGNTSVLSTYTDINLKAGSNVTISYLKNNTTKYTDVTISATGGGGGSVGGVVRSINTINTSQTAGNNSGTDYVYIASAGIQVTLPDAALNTNLYTIKNTSTSSVLVNTTAAQTIDTQPTVIMPVQYTSIDLISDGSNWQIT